MQTFVFVPPDAMSAIGAWPPVSRQPGRQAEDGGNVRVSNPERHFQRHFRTALAGAPSPETPLGDPGSTRSQYWRRLAVFTPRGATMWADDCASAGERHAAGHEEAAGRKALGAMLWRPPRKA
jgi:hypothetical protein